MLVDTLGCLLAVLVLAADIADRDGAELLLELYHQLYPWLEHIWADGSYAGALVTDLLTEYGIRLEIVSQLSAQPGFAVLPRRWVVERTLAWLTQGRRLVRDYERNPAYSEAWVWLSAIRRTVKYLEPDPSARTPFQRRAVA